jgi:catechol 2,3-dioxygenase-like lactoylglutathione lyase family enzyme
MTLSSHLAPRLGGIMRAFFALLALGAVFGAALDGPRLAAFREYPAVMGENHVKMTVPDLNDATKWYEDNLGFTRLSIVQKHDQKSRVLLARGSNMIEMVDGGGVIGPVAAPTARGGIAGAVPLRFDDVDAVLEELREHGVEVVQEPRFSRRRDLRVAIVRDLYGRPIEIQQPL